MAINTTPEDPRHLVIILDEAIRGLERIRADLGLLGEAGARVLADDGEFIDSVLGRDTTLTERQSFDANAAGALRSAENLIADLSGMRAHARSITGSLYEAQAARRVQRSSLRAQLAQ